MASDPESSGLINTTVAVLVAVGGLFMTVFAVARSLLA